jgi:hypothetical protein
MLTQKEEMELKRLQQKKSAEKYQKDKEEEDRRWKGYLFYCSEGCGFVSRHHRCEQWSSLTSISPELFTAIRKVKG